MALQKHSTYCLSIGYDTGLTQTLGDSRGPLFRSTAHLKLWSDTNSKRCTRPIVNPQHRLLAIGTKEFPMDYLLMKKSDSTYLFCARASACALAGVLPFTLPLTFACALPCNAPAMHFVRAVFDMTALDRPTYAACLGGCDGCLRECTTLS